MAESRLNNSISNCFGDDLLGFNIRLKTELNADVTEENLAVTNVDLLEPKLDDGMFQTLDES